MVVQGEIWRRNVTLLRHLMCEVEDAGAVPLPVLVGSAVEFRGEDGAAKWSAKTVENTVRDLAAFGALRAVQRGRDRVYSVTVLGVAWMEQVLLPPLEASTALAGAVFELVEQEP